MMETKTAKKRGDRVKDFSPWPQGNVGPEKWAAAIMKITVLGRDGAGTWGSRRGWEEDLQCG